MAVASAQSRLFHRKPIRTIFQDLHLLSHILPRERLKYYQPVRLIGRGEFGIVFEAYAVRTKTQVAIKRFFDDPKIRSRELELLQATESRYVVKLLDFFYGPAPAPHSRYCFLVTEFCPLSLAQYAAQYNAQAPIPSIMRKLFAFQIFAGLDYLHQRDVIHRDIDLTNCFVDPDIGKLVIGDFGSAKFYDANTDSTPYLFSRSYRAPELIAGRTRYSKAVDIWAAGCVFAELLKGSPLFVGSSQAETLFDIVRVLGRPPRGFFDGYDQPVAKRVTSSLAAELPLATKEELDLLRSVLVFQPERRPAAEQIMCHHCFDELFSGLVALPNRVPVPVMERGGFGYGAKMDFGEGDEDEDGEGK
jgi:glycogen synthase kinase 3 beta